MIKGTASLRYELIQETMAKYWNVVTISDLCALAGVSRSGYYRWVNAAETRKKKEAQDQADYLLILEAYRYKGYNKGAQGIQMRLDRTGVHMNIKKIRRLMKKYGLMCPIRKQNPYRQLMRELRTDITFENLVDRKFKEHGARKILLTDITYIRLNGGFVYLSVIIDAYTMQVLSYRLSDNLKVDFVLDTVKGLTEEHGVSLDEETLIHSDQGCHYTSVKFRELIEKNSELTQSMSRKGNCWDNAPQESFFGHMKDELEPYSSRWKTYQDVQARIDDWMDYYNNGRYQVGLKKMSPNEYYHYCITGEYPPGYRSKRASGAGAGVKEQYAEREALGQSLTEATRKTL